MPRRRNAIFTLVLLLGILCAETNADQLQFGHTVSSNDAHLLDSTVKRPAGFVRIGRHGNFVRIGRPSSFLRIGRNSPAPYMEEEDADELSDANQHNFLRLMRWYPHLHRFIRIGRNNKNVEPGDDEDDIKVQHGSEIFEAPEKGNFNDNPSKKSNFVRIGRVSGDTTLATRYSFNTDTPSVNHDEKRKSGFVRIGKSLLDSPREQDLPMIGNTAENKRKPGFVRIGRPSVSYPETYTDSKNDHGDLYDYDDKRSSSFVRIGKALDNSMQKVTAESPFPRHTLKSYQGYNREGNDNSYSNEDYGGATDISPSENSFKSDGTEIRSSKRNQRSSDYSPSKAFKTMKRSSPTMSRQEKSPNFAENIDALIETDRRMDGPASRRSAFVRIGKIPSSAFVRIGKNFDRVFKLPVRRDRRYHQYVRKGQSSFVRIG